MKQRKHQRRKRHIHLFPMDPLEGGSLYSAVPALWVFEGHISMVPMIALTVVAAGGVMGGLMQRFGQAGFWAVSYTHLDVYKRQSSSG